MEEKKIQVILHLLSLLVFCYQNIPCIGVTFAFAYLCFKMDYIPMRCKPLYVRVLFLPSALHTATTTILFILFKPSLYSKLSLN